MLMPWRFIAMTSMNSSWVIIAVVPPVGLVQLDAQDPGGALDRPGGYRSGGTKGSAQRGFRRSQNATFTDRRSRVSVITERGFQRSRTAVLDWAVTEPYQHDFNVNK